MTATLDSPQQAVTHALQVGSKHSEGARATPPLTAVVVPPSSSQPAPLNDVTDNVPHLASAFSAKMHHHVLEWNVAKISIKIAGSRFNLLRPKHRKQPQTTKTIVGNIGKHMESNHL